MIIKNAMVFREDGSFNKQNIYIKNDRITEAFSEEGEKIIDAEGKYAIPGLTDIHFHGSVGYDFCDGSIEAIAAIAEFQAKNGTTNICPATMTLGDDALSEIFSMAANYQSDKGASLVGIHMEGPYISCAKKGAQNPAFIRKAEINHFNKMQALSGGQIKIVSIAPEEEGALDFIEEAHKQGVVLSIAHTTADYDTSMEAMEKGASHVTHLWNAMPPFTHRAPGVIGAAFDTKKATVELICDGVHIEPSVVRATYQLFGDDRVVLVSDSMMACGMEDGQYSLGGQAVTVVGNKATLIDGTIAGSVTNLYKCMQTAVKFGIPFGSAVKSAAVNPAKKIGVYDNYGSIDFGKFANILLVDDQYNLDQVVLRGKLL